VTRGNDETYTWSFWYTIIFALADFIIILVAWSPITAYYNYQTKVVCYSCAGEDPLSLADDGTFCAPGYVQSD
jgi:hypothetical protein